MSTRADKISLALAALLIAGAAQAELPTGYFVWIKGDEGDRASRKVHRMTLPDKSDVMTLTSGEDVECQISPDGRWVAYAKAKLPASDYHAFNRFKLYIVSIHGVGDGREEIKIDDNGYWPSWGGPDTLYYSQVDSDNLQHTRIMKVKLDEYGNILEQGELFATQSAFGDVREINEAYVAPDESWFAARTRGSASVSGVGAYSLESPSFEVLAQAGSVGCMPYVAPSGTWGFAAGRDEGILWGDAPTVADRQSDQVLIAPRGDGDLCYHPGISTDEQWVMAAHSTDDDHNAGAYDIYIYELSGRNATAGQLLVGGDFNGWPHIWVGEPSEPPPPLPRINRFLPDSYTVLTGEAVELSWQTSFADAVTLDDQPVDADGSAVVNPTTSTTYTLVATSSLVADVTETATVDITVNDTAQPVQVLRFEAEPATIVAGNTAVLSWEVANPYTVELDGEPVAPIGSREVNPLETASYTLSATGHQGPVSEEVTVTVDPLEDLFDLLPDRGGCMCGATSSLGGALFGLLALGLLVLRRRRARQPSR